MTLIVVGALVVAVLVLASVTAALSARLLRLSEVRIVERMARGMEDERGRLLAIDRMTKTWPQPPPGGPTPEADPEAKVPSQYELRVTEGL